MLLHPISLMYASGAGGGGWAPSDLSGTNAAFDVQDLSTMNTAANGTGSQPTVGQQVELLEDIGGGGYDLTFDGAAPYLRQDGSSNYYLEFDGSTMRMENTAFPAATIVNPTVCFAGNWGTAPGGYTEFLSLGLGGGGGETWSLTDNGSNSQITVINGTRRFPLRYGTSPAVWSTWLPTGSSDVQLSEQRKDGVDQVQVSQSAEAVSLTDGISLAGRVAPSGDLRLYRALFCLSDQSASFSDIEQWLADSCGVSI